MKKLILLISVLVFGIGCDRNNPRDAFILKAVTDRPGLELQDLYKLLYQGHFGIGHMLASRTEASAYLNEEISALRSMPVPAGAMDEPLIETCSADGHMVRINLRPFTAAGHDPEMLLDGMVETARLCRPDSAGFKAEWKRVGRLIDANRLAYDRQEYDRFTTELCKKGFPAVHHSGSYRLRYAPAYRVVLRESFLMKHPRRDDEGK